jgi:hypothetical protein
MIKIKPKFAYDEKGQKIGVVLIPKDFEALVDVLEDYQDYEFVRNRKRKKEKTYTLEEIRAEFLGKE